MHHDPLLHPSWLMVAYNWWYLEVLYKVVNFRSQDCSFTGSNKKGGDDNVGLGGFWQDTRQDIRALMSAADTFYCAALCWEFDTMSSWATGPRGKGHQSHFLPSRFYCDRQYFCAYTIHWYYCSLSPVSRFQEEPSTLDFCSCYISADIWRFRNWSIYEDKSTIWPVYDQLIEFNYKNDAIFNKAESLCYIDIM